MAGAGNRVVAIDVWRGLALATIFVNHVPGNVLEPYTHKNFGFSDAAELFVLLAGVSVAIVYLPKFADGRWLRETLRIWLRAFHLYTIHLLVLLVCAAIVAFTMLKTGDTRLGEALHFDVLFNRPVEGLLGVATLGLQPSYIDILPLYVVLLLAAPLILIATVASPVLALSLSLAIYAAAALLHLHVPTYPADGHWFFNPLSWQLLFTLGVCLGAMVRAGQSVPANPWLIGLSLAYLCLLYTSRTIMRAAEGDARRRGEPFRYRVQARTGEVEIVVDAAYRTLLTKWIGTTELPAGFALTFRHGDPS